MRCPENETLVSSPSHHRTHARCCCPPVSCPSSVTHTAACAHPSCTGGCRQTRPPQGGVQSHGSHATLLHPISLPEPLALSGLGGCPVPLLLYPCACISSTPLTPLSQCLQPTQCCPTCAIERVRVLSIQRSVLSRCVCLAGTSVYTYSLEPVCMLGCIQLYTVGSVGREAYRVQPRGAAASSRRADSAAHTPLHMRTPPPLPSMPPAECLPQPVSLLPGPQPVARHRDPQYTANAPAHAWRCLPPFCVRMPVLVSHPPPPSQRRSPVSPTLAAHIRACGIPTKRGPRGSIPAAYKCCKQSYSAL